jgi:hypothetical protein
MIRLSLRAATAAYLLAATPVYPATPGFSDSVQGNYKAVTESDESPRRISRTETQARWSVKDDILSVTLSGSKPDQVVTYQVSTCVSYKWFGGNGCSPGLRPLGTGTQQPYVQPLWNTKTFKFP